jgi:hypothetical protein
MANAMSPHIREASRLRQGIGVDGAPPDPATPDVQKKRLTDADEEMRKAEKAAQRAMTLSRQWINIGQPLERQDLSDFRLHQEELGRAFPGSRPEMQVDSPSNRPEDSDMLLYLTGANEEEIRDMRLHDVTRERVTRDLLDSHVDLGAVGNLLTGVRRKQKALDEWRRLRGIDRDRVVKLADLIGDVDDENYKEAKRVALKFLVANGALAKVMNTGTLREKLAARRARKHRDALVNIAARRSARST